MQVLQKLSIKKINAIIVISELMASFRKVLRSFGNIGKKFTLVVEYQYNKLFPSLIKKNFQFLGWEFHTRLAISPCHR